MKLKGKIKELTALTSAICMLSVPNTTVLAATGTKINSVALSIESEIEAWDTDSDVTVSTSSSEFDIDDVVITNEPSDEWDDGDKPKFKITLYADDDYYFASGFSKSSVSLSGSDGTVTSVSRSSSDTLVVYVTLDALDDSDHDLDVSGLEWDESDGTDSWEESDDAKKYEVRLYRGSSAVTSVLTTTSTSYDFSGYITKSGYYTFKVRGVYNTSNKGSWEESDLWCKGARGTDFMRSTDDRIDYERRSGAELSELRREVERGRELCAGVRSANPGKRWGDVLELRYCEDRTLQEIAGTLGVSVRSVNSDLCAALDWTDMVGLAAARSGLGRAAV